MTDSTADTILVHVKLHHTGGSAQDDVALAVSDGLIVDIGTSSEIAKQAGPDTLVVDGQGAHVFPGFYESHMHLFEGGTTLTRCDLSKTFGQHDTAEALRAHAKAYPDAALVCGFGTNYTIFGEDQRPDRHFLDQILPDRPVYITAVDYHTAWANTAALKLAGIMSGHALEGEACVVMAEDGQATGELREFAAMDLVACFADTGGRETLGLTGSDPDTVSEADVEADLGVLRQGLAYCAAHGITKIINMDGNFHQLDLLQELNRRGELPCRVELPYTLMPDTSPEELAGIADRMEKAAGGMLSVGRFKMFMDGVFDNWTAVVTDEYPDRPGYAGHPLVAPERFKALCIEADRLGWQISVHAVGDGAVRHVLDGYEAARVANGPRDSRHRIEHIDTIHDEDIPRLRELGVVASMQPVHPPGSAGLPLEPTLSLMGQDRWRNAFAWRRLHDEGIPMAFATDWPVSPLDPLFAIQSAMIRKPWTDDLPDHRLTLEECFEAYTQGGAFAAFDEKTAGKLQVGMQADLVLLSGDLKRLETDGEPGVKCALTMCNGRITHASQHVTTNQHEISK